MNRNLLRLTAAIWPHAAASFILGAHIGYSVFLIGVALGTMAYVFLTTR